MFEKGATVYYGTAGVCKVRDVCLSPFDKNDERMYYVLDPLGIDNSTVIYAPAEGGRVVLRCIMSTAEAEELLRSLPELDGLEIENEKHRREEYKNAVRGADPRRIARLIKTIYIRKKNTPKGQKRISDTDVEFDKLGRKALLGELAAVFGVAEAEAERRFNASLGNCIK